MNTYTFQEVMQYVMENDVKFIRLAFCDIFGTQKNISIMPRELSRAFREGISIDASSIRGFANANRSDLLLFPEPSTLSVLPWASVAGRVVRFFCDIKYPDGTPFECDARQVLRQAQSDMKKLGYSVKIGTECEFYLLKQDEEGLPTKTPHDNASYMDIAPLDKGENVRRQICLTLEEMNLRPEASHHETGPGQNEIDFAYDSAVTGRRQPHHVPRRGQDHGIGKRSVRVVPAKNLPRSSGQRSAHQSVPVPERRKRLSR